MLSAGRPRDAQDPVRLEACGQKSNSAKTAAGTAQSQRVLAAVEGLARPYKTGWADSADALDRHMPDGCRAPAVGQQDDLVILLSTRRQYVGEQHGNRHARSLSSTSLGGRRRKPCSRTTRSRTRSPSNARRSLLVARSAAAWRHRPHSASQLDTCSHMPPKA